MYAATMETKDVKVSIIIPVYQVSAYIERCIRSVLNQTYKEIECIIVNDATQDDSIEKCQQLIENYRGEIRFKIVNHNANRGLSAARNTGIDAASESYIFYLDGDDEISSDCIEKLVKPCKKDGSIEMVMGALHAITKGNVLSRYCQRRMNQLGIISLAKVASMLVRGIN